MSRNDPLYDVQRETDRGRAKFGDQFDLLHLEWLAILAEEAGEVAMAVTKGCVRPVEEPLDLDALRAELTQVAAVAVRWIRAIDVNRGQA